LSGSASNVYRKVVKRRATATSNSNRRFHYRDRRRAIGEEASSVRR
jgi:hypothetical protein